MCAETGPTAAMSGGNGGIGIGHATGGEVAHEAGFYTTPMTTNAPIVSDTRDPGTSKEASADSGWGWQWLSLLGIHPGFNPLALIMLALCCCLCCGLPLGIFLYSSGLFEHLMANRTARAVRSRSSVSCDIDSEDQTRSEELKLSNAACAAPLASSSVPMSLQCGSPMSAANPVWWRRWWPLAQSPTIRYVSIPSAEGVTAAEQPDVYRTTSWLSVDGYHTVSKAVKEAVKANSCFHTLSPCNSQSTLVPPPSVSSIATPASCSTVPPMRYSPRTPPRTLITHASGAIDGVSLQHHQAMSISRSPLRAGLADRSDLELSRRQSPRQLSPLVSGSSVASAPTFTPRHVGGSLQFTAGLQAG